ncbi:MAG: Na+/H+ antiporter subunit E [Chloroflexota bacterium]|nr:Na+/H+ antiporter subunit E [Chloroflexota bacterium]
MTRLVLSVAVLTLVYAFTLASFDPWDLGMGALVATALLLLFRPVTIGHRAAHLPGLPARVVAFLPFAARVAADVVVGTWHVALVIVGLRPLREADLVEVPVEERSHRGVAVTALVTTLAPGSYFVGVDWDRRVMLFHFLEGDDPDAIRRHMAELYERYQRRVFP